ncbi:helix-turn-helix transcriptional regulator [Cytobacillus sp. IB215665]|uniref:helix-turn-helix transcriptional regulator n=1 Tax=Cytobacillus sp. IB215665 TaxID=3097357 RepID=UPI002A1228E1|nr:helix-turn-helix transcriptional regulator [Cytobacillus sp. IB215665]MDX8367081.1 helix-turn-helix transcriptional regulator [Cytobacillus sp. IB215665]
MILITRMKEYRAKHNISQSELANAVGVRRETIGNIENGKYNPSLKLAMDIAKILNTTVEELFSFKDENEVTI